MNIVFWVLVIVGGVILWLKLSPYFWGIGDSVSSLLGEAKESMNETDITETEEDEEIGK